MFERPVEILLVDHNAADARLTREALLEGNIPKRIYIVADGAQAIDFVRKRGDFRNAPRPDLVLLDLNLPKRDGLDVLREIKSDANLRSITVIVLTTSQFPKDINAAYELSANCYVVKPVDLTEFYGVMRGIEEFWMAVASLPTFGRDPAVGAGGAPGEKDTPANKDDSASSRLGRTVARPIRRCTVKRKPQMNADQHRLKANMISVYLRSSAATK
jgi:CheY-like chemotaxis protein